MTSHAASKLTLSFEPSLPERFASLRAYVAFRAQAGAKPLKSIAADMDMAPSTLSRKLNPHEGDTQRMNLDDLEAYLQSTGDAAAVIEYLAAKYLDTPEASRARVLSRAEQLIQQFSEMLPMLKEPQA